LYEVLVGARAAVSKYA